MKDACVTAAIRCSESVTQNDLLKSCVKVKEELENLSKAADHTQSTLKDLLQKKADEQAKL